MVANEIKELARQTATATEDIKAQIAGIQSSTGSAITDIHTIAGVIDEVGRIVASIAAAIEEQAAVTKDVARNIAQASGGVHDANERVSQTATVSKSIAEDIDGVSGAIGDVRQGGEQVYASAAELSMLAEQLNTVVERFKVGDSPDEPGLRQQRPWWRGATSGPRASRRWMPSTDSSSVSSTACTRP